MLPGSEESIRNAAWKKQLGFSAHANRRMGERKITDEEVYDCVLYGQVIDIQDHGRDIKVIFQEPSSGTPGKYVVVADNSPWPEVVTVCLTYEEVWEDVNGLLKRREKP